MTERRDAATLASPPRCVYCVYCGHRCHGRTCRHCTDLARIEAAMTREPKPKPATPDFRATCPNCAELAPPRAFACPACGTALYLPKTDPFYRPPGEAAQATKGTEA